MQPSNMSDIIEEYLKNVLLAQEKVEIRRSEIADRFNCVPSQINYVINTRFTVQQGYVVESKRGGGGYIRIGRIEFSNHHDMLRDLLYSVGDEVNQVIFEDVLRLLVEQELMTRQEMSLLLAMGTDRILGEEANYIRANMLRQLLHEVDRKGK